MHPWRTKRISCPAKAFVGSARCISRTKNALLTRKPYSIEFFVASAESLQTHTHFVFGVVMNRIATLVCRFQQPLDVWYNSNLGDSTADTCVRVVTAIHIDLISLRRVLVHSSFRGNFRLQLNPLLELLKPTRQLCRPASIRIFVQNWIFNCALF